MPPFRHRILVDSSSRAVRWGPLPYWIRTIDMFTQVRHSSLHLGLRTLCLFHVCLKHWRVSSLEKRGEIALPENALFGLSTCAFIALCSFNAWALEGGEIAVLRFFTRDTHRVEEELICSRVFSILPRLSPLRSFRSLSRRLLPFSPYSAPSRRLRAEGSKPG